MVVEMKVTPKTTKPKPLSRALDPAGAEELAQTVNRIVRRLRSGKAVRLPGLGDLLPGKHPRFVKEGESGDGQGQTRRSKERES